MLGKVARHWSSVKEFHQIGLAAFCLWLIIIIIKETGLAWESYEVSASHMATIMSLW